MHSKITAMCETPPKTTEIVYEFDQDSVRWKINHAITNKEKFVSSDNGWKVII